MITMKTTLYADYRYDKDYTLKLSPLLWIIILYSLRHFIIVGLSFLPRLHEVAFLREQVEPVMLASNIPVLMLIIAYARRQPDASAIVRYIWKNGRILISASVVLHLITLCIVEWSLLTHLRPDNFSSLINTVAIDACILVYIWRSKLARDIFADFPMRLAAQ